MQSGGQGISGPWAAGDSDNRTALQRQNASPNTALTDIPCWSPVAVFGLLRVAKNALRDERFFTDSLIETLANIVIVHPSVPVKSVKELIALAKARPESLTTVRCHRRCESSGVELFSPCRR